MVVFAGSNRVGWLYEGIILSVCLKVQEAKRMKKTFDIMIQEWDHWDVSCSLQSVKT